MQRYGYAAWKEIDEELLSLQPGTQVLGKLDDGIYTCQIVRLKQTDKQEWELTIKCGQQIFVTPVGFSVVKLLQWATGWRRPDGGVAIFHIKRGELDAIAKIESTLEDGDDHV